MPGAFQPPLCSRPAWPLSWCLEPLRSCTSALGVERASPRCCPWDGPASARGS